MKLYSKDGIEMMEIKSIEPNGDIIVIKGKMMKSMATTIHVKPADAWAAFKLFPMRLLIRLPLLMLKGRKQLRSPGETRV
jgi:hypothetical protein